MEQIVRLPTVYLSDSRESSYFSESLFNINNIKYVSPIGHRFSGEVEQVSLCRIYLRSGQYYHIMMSYLDLSKILKTPLLKLGSSFFLLKSFTAIINYLPNEYIFESDRDSRQSTSTLNRSYELLTEGNIINHNIESIISIWEKETTSKPFIKNFKIASGSNL